MGEAVRGGVHRCTEECSRPARCIICNRLKCPTGAAVPPELDGMRCDPRCVGYHLDPLAGHLWPPMSVAGRDDAERPMLVGAAAAAADLRGGASIPVDPTGSGLPLLAWALHQAHPPGGDDRPPTRPVTYRLACLLMGAGATQLTAELVAAGCTVRQTCEALGSVVLDVTGDALAIIAVLDGWDGPGSVEIVPPPPAST